MSILRNKTALSFVLLAGLLGCGSSDNPTPPDASPIVTADAGADSAVTPDTAVAPDAGTTDDAALTDTATADGGADTGTAVDAGGDASPGVPGCLPGKPTNGNSVQFLNACGPGACYPFDNKRLSRLVGGALPPLP